MDLLNFPELTTSVLEQAFGFLFGRLEHVLDNRGRKTIEGEENVVIPGVMEGRSTPLSANPAAVEDALAELRELAGILGVYERHPSRLDGRDTVLREHLGRLRLLLEGIYGESFTLRGETRPTTGATVRQQVGVVSGEVVGVHARRVRQAEISQDVNEVRPTGSVVGIEADDLG